MKKLLVFVSLALVLVVWTLSAEANQHRQARRIHQGKRSGQLTPGESKKLREEKRALRKQARDAHADGNVSKEERRNLRKARRERSKDIHALKHNDETTVPRAGTPDAAPAAPAVDAAPAAPVSE